MPTDKTISRDRESYSYWTSVSLRYSDQDPMQHINNVAIAALLESGRVGLFGHIFADTPLTAESLVLARLTVDYLQEITFPGSVDVGGMLAQIGDRSMTTHYAIFQGDACCVISQSVTVFFDPVTRRSAQPTADVRAALQNFHRQGTALTPQSSG